MVSKRWWPVVGLCAALAVSAGGAWAAMGDPDTGSIAGRLVGPDGQGLFGVAVSAYMVDSATDPSWEGIGQPVDGGSGSDGIFSVEGLESGTYVLKVGGQGWATVFVPSAISIHGATQFEVTADGQTPVGDVSLNPAGTIEGNVENEDGQSAEGAYVQAIPVLEDGLDSQLAINGTGQVNASNHFVLDGLPAGSFTIVVAGDLDYLDASSIPADGTDGSISVDWGATVELSEPIVREQAGSIGGTVSSADGSDVSGLQVTLRLLGEDGAIDNVASTETTEGGTYVFAGLPAGEYIPAVERQQDLVVVDQPTDFTSVVPGEVATAGDAVVAVGGGVSGLVLDEAGSPVEGVKVVAFEPTDDPEDPWVGAAFAYTDSDGKYEVEGLMAGSTVVWIEGNDDLLAAYSNGPRFEEDAMIIPVELGVDVELAPAMLAPAGKIVGQVAGPVTNSAGATAVVLAYQQQEDGLVIVAGGQVRDDGTFTVGGLFSGTYLVRAFDGTGRSPQGADEGLIEVDVDASGEPVQVSGLSVEE
ncbi:MAG: carboxypeptidase-like regulatory domain-containing protein [Bifidobacteriaceae bacterium]|nr:carboxypeptidase-like regulatory domain-containing protein [Bifidobacteriaceae bacterium]